MEIGTSPIISSMLLRFFVKSVLWAFWALAAWAALETTGVGKFALGASKAVYRSTHNNLFAGAILLLICGGGIYVLALVAVTLLGAVMYHLNKDKMRPERSPVLPAAPVILSLRLWRRGHLLAAFLPGVSVQENRLLPLPAVTVFLPAALSRLR